MIQKLGLILLVSIAILLQLTPNSTYAEFDQWKSTYGRQYSSVIEQSYRKMVFAQNLQKIEKHNADDSQTYKMAANQFADLTQQEFSKQYLKSLKMKSPTMNIDLNHNLKSNSQQQSNIDWLSTGKVSRTRSGSCGSNWVFQIASVIQSAKLVAGKPLQLLSVQQIIDCSNVQGNEGCDGYVFNTMDYIKKYGLLGQQEYPYVGAVQSCKKYYGEYVLSRYLSFQGCQNILAGLRKQPILVGAESANWAFYKSGIFSNCGSSINLIVILVGWTQNYWTAMNNWGTTWGENGMIRLAPGNTCGICNVGVQPIVIV